MLVASAIAWCAERTAQRPRREHRERAVRCSGKFDASLARHALTL
jgi:hypothetical protein